MCSEVLTVLSVEVISTLNANSAHCLPIAEKIFLERLLMVISLTFT